MNHDARFTRRSKPSKRGSERRLSNLGSREDRPAARPAPYKPPRTIWRLVPSRPIAVQLIRNTLVRHSLASTNLSVAAVLLDNSHSNPKWRTESGTGIQIRQHIISDSRVKGGFGYHYPSANNSLIPRTAIDTYDGVGQVKNWRQHYLVNGNWSRVISNNRNKW